VSFGRGRGGGFFSFCKLGKKETARVRNGEEFGQGERDGKSSLRGGSFVRFFQEKSEISLNKKGKEGGRMADYLEKTKQRRPGKGREKFSLSEEECGESKRRPLR